MSDKSTFPLVYFITTLAWKRFARFTDFLFTGLIIIIRGIIVLDRILE